MDDPLKKGVALKLNTLPTEILEIILLLVGIGFHFPISMVCRRWNHIIYDYHIRKFGSYQLRTAFSISKHSLNLSRWLCNNGYTPNENDCNYAVSNGDFDILKLLRSIECPWNKKVYIIAAEKNHFEILKWCHENRCPQWDARVPSCAIENGNLDMLEWIYNRGCKMNVYVFYMAAKYNHLHILKWLKNKNIPWGLWVYNGGVQSGNIDILNWLKESDCPWNNTAFDDALDLGNQTVLDWLIDNGFAR